MIFASDSNTPTKSSAAESSNIRSVKEAVRIAQSNNLMGLVCCSWLFDVVPALIEAIKVAGLVLVSDETTGIPQHEDAARTDNIASASPTSISRRVPSGVDGVLRHGGVLTFNETINV